MAEYQAAASVVLTTTSIGTRSANASLEALIVRRIPFPALKNKTTTETEQPEVKHMKLFCLPKGAGGKLSTFITYSNEDTTRPIEVINPALLGKGKGKGFG